MFTAKTLAAASAVAFFAAAPVPASAQNVLFMVDFSGSMNRQVDGRPMISVAKEIFRSTLREMPQPAKVGLMLYGHRRARDCKDIEIVAPVGRYPASALGGSIEDLQAKGETPIATSLMQAAGAFSGLKGEKNSVVLITDGKEECNGDPCSAASALAGAGLDVNVHVVGFRLTAEQKRDVACISELTGGTYHDAQNASGLKAALASVSQVVQVTPPPAPQAPVVAPKAERFNLISQKNGGEVLISGGPAWTGINDDLLKHLSMFRANEEVVFGFASDRTANIDTFAIYIPEKTSFNPKEMELFVGDEGPSGAFRSLGVINPLDARVRDGWQEFRLPPQTTGKFFKVKLVSGQGSMMYLYEMRLYGTLQ